MAGPLGTVGSIVGAPYGGGPAQETGNEQQELLLTTGSLVASVVSGQALAVGFCSLVSSRSPLGRKTRARISVKWETKHQWMNNGVRQEAWVRTKVREIKINDLGQ